MKKKSTAKDAIAESLLELCQTKNICYISVKQIMENCGFSRKTFYNNFDTKYDVSYYLFEKAANDIISRYADKEPWGVVLGRIYRFMYDNSTLFGKQWIAEDREKLISQIIDYVRDYYIKTCIELHGEEKVTERFLFLCQYNSYGSTNMVADFLKGKLKITPEELGINLADALPEDVRRLTVRYVDV